MEWYINTWKRNRGKTSFQLDVAIVRFFFLPSTLKTGCNNLLKHFLDGKSFCQLKAEQST